MNAHHNIQHLFAWISAGQIRRYLIDQGWQARPTEGTERWYFDRTFAGGEKAATVWTWVSAEHPKFRHQVPNIVFALSVLEGRPALDIANQIYSAEADAVVAATEASQAGSAGEATAPTSTAAAPTFHRIILRLSYDTTLTATQETLSDVVQAAAGEVVEIVHYGGSDGGLELEIAPGSIKATMAASVGLKLLQGVAKPRLGSHWSAAQIVCEEMGRLEDRGDSRQAARLLEELGPVLSRIDFEIDFNARIDEHQQAHVLRQTAVLAAALARRLQSVETAADVVWRSCALLLYPAGLRLELRSTTAEELFQIAAIDSEAGPKQTLLWLKENSTSVV